MQEMLGGFKLKNLLSSFVIVIFSYYPVHAERLDSFESEDIIGRGEIMSSNLGTKTLEKGWFRYKVKVFWCEIKFNFADNLVDSSQPR